MRRTVHDHRPIEMLHGKIHVGDGRRKVWLLPWWQLHLRLHWSSRAHGKLLSSAIPLHVHLSSVGWHLLRPWKRGILLLVGRLLLLKRSHQGIERVSWPKIVLLRVLHEIAHKEKGLANLSNLSKWLRLASCRACRFSYLEVLHDRVRDSEMVDGRGWEIIHRHANLWLLGLLLGLLHLLACCLFAHLWRAIHHWRAH